MDTEGPSEVASRGNERGEDTKVDLVVRDLKCGGGSTSRDQVVRPWNI